MTEYYKDNCMVCGQFLKWNNSNTVCAKCLQVLNKENPPNDTCV